MAGERRKLPAERPGILLVQVDLLLRAAQPEPHGLRYRAAVKIVFQGDRYPRGHPDLHACGGYLHRTEQVPVPR